MANVVARNGWLNGETRTVPYQIGTPLGAFADQYMPAHLLEFVCCQKNGEPLHEWRDFIPEDGDHILLYILPQGGSDSGKSGLLSVVAIALSVAAPYVAPMLGTYGAAIYAVGSSLVLSALQSALIKPPEQQRPIEYDSSGSNPFLSFSNTQNRMEPWGNVLKAYGRVRVFPKLLLQPKQISQDLSEYLSMAFDFGYAPLQLTDIKLGEVAIGSYTEVELIVHPEFVRENRRDPARPWQTSNLQLFDSISKTTVINQELLPDSLNEVPMTTELQTFESIVKISFPRGIYRINSTTGKKSPTSSGFTLKARPVTVPAGAWQDLGELATLTGDLPASIHSLRWVWAPVTLSLQKWERNGIWYTGIPAGETSITAHWTSIFGVSALVGGFNWVSDNSGVIDPFTACEVLAITNGAVIPGGGFIPPYDVEMAWDGRELIFNSYPNQSQVPLNPTATITAQIKEQNPPLGKTNAFIANAEVQDTGFALDFRVRWITPGQYEIRAFNEQAVPDQYTVRDVYVSQLTSLVDFNTSAFLPEVPHTVVELRIRATDQLSGALDNFNAIVESVLPQWNGASWDEPTYDSNSHQWTGQTRNPAWIYLDVLRGTANKRPVPDRLIDLDAFLDWANNCDAVLPNDPGIASYFCDLLVDGSSTVKEILGTIASCGRASPARNDAKFSIIRDDENRTPVQLITPKNSFDFQASLSYIDAPHAIKVSFLDEAQGYSAQELIVYNDGYSAGNATVFETLNLPGTVRRNQAWRLTRYFMAAAILQRERVSCGMDYEQLICQRGDLVLVAHDVLKAGGLPRRVVSVVSDAAGDFIEFDEAITTTTAIRYRGSDTIIAVTQIDNTHVQLPAGQTPPLVDDIVEYGVSQTIRAPFSVEEITPGGNLSAQLTLVEHRPEINDATTGTIPPRLPRPGASGEFVIDNIRQLELSEQFYYQDGYQYARMSLKWLPPALGHADYYNVFQIVDGVPIFVGKTIPTGYDNALTINVSDLIDAASYEFGVQAVVDKVGVSDTITVGTTIQPDSNPPADVEDFGCNAQTGTLLLYWAQTNDEDVHHFEIRFSPDVSASWSDSNLLTDELPYNSTSYMAPLRPGIYFIKAVDGAGNYSPNTKSTVVQVSDLEYVDQFAVLDFSPFISGTYDNTEIRAGSNDLILSPDQVEGYYYPAENISVAALSKMRLYSAMTLQLISVDELLESPWFIPMATAKPIAPSGLLGANIVDAQIEFRYKDSSGTNTWSPWARLVVADVTATDVEFRLRLRTKDVTYTPAVSGATVKADYLERTERGSDIAIPAAVTTVDFQFAFSEMPSLAITLENAQAGDYYSVTNITRSGFDIGIYDNGSTLKAGQIDYIAYGFGKEY